MQPNSLLTNYKKKLIQKKKELFNNFQVIENISIKKHRFLIKYKNERD
jgi:hypothetical protein